MGKIQVIQIINKKKDIIIDEVIDFENSEEIISEKITTYFSMNLIDDFLDYLHEKKYLKNTVKSPGELDIDEIIYLENNAIMRFKAELCTKLKLEKDFKQKLKLDRKTFYIKAEYKKER